MVLAYLHTGRPKDGPEEKFSLKPVAKRMGELMKKDVKCAPDCKAADEVNASVAAEAAAPAAVVHEAPPSTTKAEAADAAAIDRA